MRLEKEDTENQRLRLPSLGRLVDAIVGHDEDESCVRWAEAAVEDDDHDVRLLAYRVLRRRGGRERIVHLWNRYLERWSKGLPLNHRTDLMTPEYAQGVESEALWEAVSDGAARPSPAHRRRGRAEALDSPLPPPRLALSESAGSGRHRPRRGVHDGLEIFTADRTGAVRMPVLLVQVDARRAVRDLVEHALDVEARRRHAVGVALDHVADRPAVAGRLLDQLLDEDIRRRQLGAYLLSWQTDGLHRQALRRLATRDYEARNGILRALDRQYRARTALALVVDIEHRAPSARMARVEAFIESCTPKKQYTPDGWSVWRRAGRPALPFLLRERLREGLRGPRDFGREG